MRTKSRGLLFIDGKLLLILREKEQDFYHVFPGGSVEAGESFEQTCVREFKEELGIDICLGAIQYEIIDHVGSTHEVFFEATLISGEVGSGLDKKFMINTPESKGYKIVTLSLEEVYSARILPSTVKDKILEYCDKNK